MSDVVPLFISVLALFGTFYQLHLQRVHNENSLKPLAQIGLLDRNRLLFVQIQNNGVGPLIVEKLTFRKGKESYERIQDCLELDPTLYDHMDIDAGNKKVIFPGAFLDLFFKQFDEQHSEKEIQLLRLQLSCLELVVEGRDIYNNNVVVEKSLRWFARHLENDTNGNAL